MNPVVHDLAAPFDGLFTTAQARAVGLSGKSLHHLVRERVIHSVARSVYGVGPAPPRDPEALLRQHSRAALLLYPDAVPVGVSALALAGVPVFGVATARGDIARPVHREVLTQLCRIRSIQDVVRPAGTQEPRLAPAVIQATLDHGHVTGVVAADHVLNNGCAGREELERLAGAVDGWPRAGRVRSMIAFADGRSQSVGETRLRLFVSGLGFECVPQHAIADEHGVFAYGDLLVDRTNLILEFDGRVKYEDNDPAVLWHEKRRELRGRRAGYQFERVIWADFHQPMLLRRRLVTAIAAAERRPSVLHPMPEAS